MVKDNRAPHRLQLEPKEALDGSTQPSQEGILITVEIIDPSTKKIYMSITAKWLHLILADRIHEKQKRLKNQWQPDPKQYEKKTLGNRASKKKG